MRFHDIYSSSTPHLRIESPHLGISWRDNPRVNTDIDIQDIQWPWFSKARGRGNRGFRRGDFLPWKMKENDTRWAPISYKWGYNSHQ